MHVCISDSLRQTCLSSWAFRDLSPLNFERGGSFVGGRALGVGRWCVLLPTGRMRGGLQSKH